MSNLVVQGYKPEELQLIKDTVAKGATDLELKLFLHRCKNMGLDPLKPGQIFFIKYGSNPGTMVVGLDGVRARAAATGKHVGTKRGTLLDADGKLIGAWAEVYRDGWREPAREEILLSEYDTNKAMWAKMKSTMAKKVAEMAALRMAFPDELGGLYSPDEMDQAQPHDVNDYIEDIEVENHIAAGQDAEAIANSCLDLARTVSDDEVKQKMIDTIVGAGSDVEKLLSAKKRITDYLNKIKG